MGVMACDRRGCENIMCNRLILDGSKYVCGDCGEELDSLPQTAEWSERMTASEVRSAIEEFMDTPVGTYKVLERDEILEEFKRLT